MRRRLKLTRIAEQIVGYKSKEVTTNYTYWLKRSLGKTSNFPKKFLDKIFFYFLLLTTYPFFFTPAINKQGIIYIPKFLLKFKNISIKILVHELNHYKFPELSEKEIRYLSKEELLTWKKSLMR